jgi:hypothetical protein
MMQCRMCSQRMTRAGRLCRECECELERARQAGVTIGDSEPDGSLDAPAPARWPARLRAPFAIVATAFVVGIAGAVALHVADASRGHVASRSVMLDADAPPDLPQVSLDADAPPDLPQVSLDDSAAVPAERAQGSAQAVAPPAIVRPMLAQAPVAQPDSVSEAPKAAAAALARHEPRVPAEPARALDDALARCGHESFFARPGCEERARAQHCKDATALPQCAVAAREYGQ